MSDAAILMNKKPLLCFTGMPGSGKSYASKIMKTEGFKIFEMSSVVTNLMKKEGVEIDSYSMRDFSTKLRTRKGKDIVSKMVAREISGIAGNIAVFGVRSNTEVEYFKKHIKNRKVYLIAVTAPAKTRYKRIIGAYRDREDEIKNYKEFVWRDNKETKWGLVMAIAAADIVVANSGSRREFSNSIRKVARYFMSLSEDGKPALGIQNKVKSKR